MLSVVMARHGRGGKRWIRCHTTQNIAIQCETMRSHQLQVEHRAGKVSWSQTDVIPLCHTTKLYNQRVHWTEQEAHLSESDLMMLLEVL